MEKMELIKKLKKLADDTRGNDNERQSAETRLNELMLKYNIKIEDIIMDEPKDRFIPFDTKYEERLIHQVAYKLWKHEKSIMSYTNKKKKFNREHLILNLTDAEFIEFQYLYDTYRMDFKKEMELFYAAFVSKNRIYPQLTEEEQERINNEPDTMSRGDRLRASMMAQGIQASEIRRRLGNGEN